MRDEQGQALHKLERSHHEMGGPVAVWRLELEDAGCGSIVCGQGRGV